MRGKRLAVAALGAIAAGCGSGEFRPEPDRPFGEVEAVALYVQYLEAERRRDADLARSVLHFRESADEASLELEYEALSRLPSGPVRTEAEIRLASHPEKFAAGMYVFLIPVGKRRFAEAIEIVFVDGEPRVVFMVPPVSAKEVAELEPAERQRLTLTRVLEKWQDLDGVDLEREAALTTETLEGLVRARSLARDEGIELAPFDPPPEALLEELEGLDAEGIRRRTLERLEKELARIATPSRAG